MSWNRNRTAIAILAVAAITSGAAAETLVVRSLGPSAGSYPPGKALPDGTVILLKAGDQLTLLDGRGTRVLRGPGNFNATGASPTTDTGARYAALVGGNGSDRRVRIGAVRGAGRPHSPSLWYVDVTQPGTVCIADPSAVVLWRPQLSEDAKLSITPGSGKPTSLTWPSGSSTLEWPASLPIKGGVEYRVGFTGSDSVNIRLVPLDSRGTGLEDTASKLIRAGCKAQLDQLVDVFAVPSADTAPAG